MRSSLQTTLLLAAAASACFSLILPGEEPAPTAPPESPVPAPAAAPETAKEVLAATDDAAISARVGQRVLIQGTVTAVEKSSAGNVRITFGGGFALYVRKADMAADPEWKPDQLSGTAIFAGGEISLYRGKPQMALRGKAQIADSAEKIDLGALPAPEQSAIAGVPAGPAPKVSRIAFTSAVADFSADRPLLVLQKVDGSWEPAGSAASLVRLQPFSTAAKSSVSSAVDAWKATHKSWPAGLAVRFARVEGEGACEPAGFAALLAMECMAAGVPWPDRLIVAGRTVADGRLAGGGSEAHLLPQAILPQGTLFMLPQSAVPALRDLVMDGKAQVFARTPVFAAASAAEAVQILTKLVTPEGQAAFKNFQEACAPVLATKDSARAAAALQSGAFRTRMAETSRLLPGLLSASILAEVQKIEESAPYSLAGTAARLREFLSAAKPKLLLLGSAKSGTEEKKKLREMTADFKTLKARAHPQWNVLTGKISACVEAGKDLLAAGSRESPKGKAAASALRKALDDAEAEAVAADRFVEPGP